MPGLCLAIVLIGAPVRAEIIDQIAAAIDDQVITTSDINSQIRVTAFLNGEQPDFSPANRRRTADRLIEQMLVRREMDLTRYPRPAVSEIEDTLKQVKSRYASEAAFEADLAARKITLPELEQALIDQAALLRFIDLRFRPEVQVEESDVDRYCENVYLPELRKKGVTPEPTLESVRPACEADFTAQLVDKRVETWLKESRDRSRITYNEDAFR
jgi:hypothetical protein